jgi:hypothetical protein
VSPEQLLRRRANSQPRSPDDPPQSPSDGDATRQGRPLSSTYTPFNDTATPTRTTSWTGQIVPTMHTTRGVTHNSGSPLTKTDAKSQLNSHKRKSHIETYRRDGPMGGHSARHRVLTPRTDQLDAVKSHTSSHSASTTAPTSPFPNDEKSSLRSSASSILVSYADVTTKGVSTSAPTSPFHSHPAKNGISPPQSTTRPSQAPVISRTPTLTHQSTNMISPPFGSGGARVGISFRDALVGSAGQGIATPPWGLNLSLQYETPPSPNTYFFSTPPASVSLATSPSLYSCLFPHTFDYDPSAHDRSHSSITTTMEGSALPSAPPCHGSDIVIQKEITNRSDRQNSDGNHEEEMAARSRSLSFSPRQIKSEGQSASYPTLSISSQSRAMSTHNPTHPTPPSLKLLTSSSASSEDIRTHFATATPLISTQSEATPIAQSEERKSPLIEDLKDKTDDQNLAPTEPNYRRPDFRFCTDDVLPGLVHSYSTRDPRNGQKGELKRKAAEEGDVPRQKEEKEKSWRVGRGSTDNPQRHTNVSSTTTPDISHTTITQKAPQIPPPPVPPPPFLMRQSLFNDDNNIPVPLRLMRDQLEVEVRNTHILRSLFSKTQHNTTQHNTTQHNTTHNTTQNTTQNTTHIPSVFSHSNPNKQTRR